MPSTSFQLATLDRDGVLKVWTVIEVSKADVAGSTRDLGLLPGSRIKLVPSATIHMDMVCLYACENGAGGKKQDGEL